MLSGKHPVRQALLAALTLLPMTAVADVMARFDKGTGSVIVTGLEPEVIQDLMSDTKLARLTVTGQASTRGMPVTLNEDGTRLVIDPRFPLRPGSDYTLDLLERQFEISVSAPAATTPRIVGFAPSQAVIPANTLRMYLHFSEPMARNQLLESVRLLRSDGSEVESSFLNLETELWDGDQRRATMLLDPGRIKQGVGPNTSDGAPLQIGESYRLIVSDQMKSAKGIALDAPVSLTFRVGPPERRAIDPGDWKILAPRAGTLAPVSVAFDRIIDDGAVLRLLTMETPDGTHIRGEVQTDGGGWSLTPSTPWAPGRYRLVVDSELEDISGNTPGVPFDAAAGTIGTVQAQIILGIDIAR